MMMQIIETPKSRPQDIMNLDADLLDSLDPYGEPILHLYEWDGPSATYGYFIDPYAYLSSEGVKKAGLQLARRPTGGGIVLHVSDYAFSFLLPSKHPAFALNTLANYAFVNQIVIDTVQEFTQKDLELLPIEEAATRGDCQHFCMAKATIYDVMLEGKKIGGAAQRRKKQGLLHQGTISIAKPKASLLQAILQTKKEVFAAMQAITYTMLPDGWEQQELCALRQKLKTGLKNNFTKTLAKDFF